VDAMRKAMPIAPSMTKEEWLEKRKALARSPTSNPAARKLHGSSAQQVPDAQARGCKVPNTVPELPNAYLVRQEDIDLLKRALLSQDAAANAVLTSKKAQNKVGAHGMVSMGAFEFWAGMNEIGACLSIAAGPNGSIKYCRAAWARRRLHVRSFMTARFDASSIRSCGCRWGRSQTFASSRTRYTFN